MGYAKGLAGMAIGVVALALSVGPIWAEASQQDEKLGKLSFPTSCDPKVQAEFERGVAMIHSYWFLVARRTFEGVLRQDPNCAIAYWGIAIDLLNNVFVAPPSRADADAAWAALEKGREIGPKTQRERDWIEALSTYYRHHDKTPVNVRLAAYNKAMEQLVQRYPDDYEAQVFYSLTLQASATPSDTTYANQLKSAAILEKLYQQNPQHPGVTHFTIHAYDFAPIAEKGLPAARRYASVAPAVPHARHMPSHIYSMLGLWDDSIASNASAIAIQPDYYHAADFSVYAYLQLAQDDKARALSEKSVATADRGDRPIVFANFTAKNAMPARYVLERADWAGAAVLPLKPSQYPAADSLTRFARGLGMARSGDLASAKAEIEAIKALRAMLEKANQSYWADRLEEQILTISAWIALKEDARDQAIKLMRAAADGEDGSIKSVAMENRLYPFRELLGELLLEMGQPAEALKEFETALRQTPNRYRALLGIARAASGAGNRQKAVEYYGKLAELTKNAEGERPETHEAKTFLAAKKAGSQ
jgi:tetratricopeptide (TPR) repeat protein